MSSDNAGGVSVLNEECCKCGNERANSVPMERVREKLDGILSKNDLAGAERLLKYWENEARVGNDVKGLIEILSEEIGLYRRMNEKDKGMAAVDEAYCLVVREGLEDSVSGATVILNCATTKKAFGYARQALDLYVVAESVYEKLLPADDFRMAGLYNNFATALAECGFIDDAQTNYTKASDILARRGDFDGELAVTYVNMAYICDKKGADECLKKAWALLDSGKLPYDGNYAFIASKCAPAFAEFGFTKEADELNLRKDEIYARN